MVVLGGGGGTPVSVRWVRLAMGQARGSWIGDATFACLRLILPPEVALLLFQGPGFRVEGLRGRRVCVLGMGGLGLGFRV